jgi:O-antigen ligase
VTERIGSQEPNSTAALRVHGPSNGHRPNAARPRIRRLPLEQVIAVTIWVLVVVNVQPWTKGSTGPQGQVAVESNTSKGAVLAAIFMLAAVLAAPQFRARMPATYLLYFVYLSAAAATAFHLLDPVPPLLRVARLGLGIAIPLLLWRWLGGRPESFLGAHRTAYLLLALTVVAGLLAVPSAAWDEGSFSVGGRLQGAFLPAHPTGVGEIGAILAGLTVTALTFRKIGRLPAGILVGLGLSLIVLSRTRTAAVALVMALFAAFCLTRKYRRGRRALLTILLLVLFAIPLATPIQSWLARGQTERQLTSFTGRTGAWSAVIDQEVSLRTVVLGHGLGNKGVLLRRGEGDIDVMAIDSGWLTLFWETGLLGVALVLTALVAAFIAVCRSPTPHVRAAAGFLVSYVVVASVTESGLSDLSSYTLHILVAAGAAYADRVSVRGERLMLPALESARARSTAIARM